MHIVYISREYPPTLRGGGIATYVQNVAVALVAAGHRVTVICAADDTSSASDEQEGNLRIIRLPGGDFVIPSVEKPYPWRKLRGLTRFHSYRRRIRETLQSIGDADIAEVAEFGAESLALEGVGLPIIIRLHTPTLLDRATCGLRRPGVWQLHEWFCGKMEKKLIQQSLALSSCSRSLAAWVQKHFKIQSGRITTIPNPINTIEWQSDIPEPRLPLSVLFVGTITREKGVATLVEACRILRQNGYPVVLTLAGKMGSYGHKLARYFQNESDWCSFAGNVPRNELPALYASHEVVCLPSLWDNMPMTCLEAMASGAIVVGSNSGGMAEIICHGINGFLCTPGDAQLWARAIALVLKMSPHEKNRIRSAARHCVTTHFSTHAITRKLLSLYEKTISLYHASHRTLG